MNWLRKTDVRTDHQYAEERLSAFLDGELSPQERMAVDRHLATCPACRWQLETLRQTVQWTRELPTVPLPRVFTIPPFSEPVPVPEPRLRRSFVPLFQGATAMLALLFVFVLAGDLLLGSMARLPAAVPEAAVGAPAPAVQVTEEAAMMIAEAPTVPVEAEAPAAKAMPEAEATAVPPPPAATEALAMEAPPPAATEAPAMEAPQIEAVAEAATATPEVGVTGAMGLGSGEPEAPAPTEAMEAARAAASPVTATQVITQAFMAADAAQPSPSAVATPPPPEPSPEPLPTAVAAAPESAPALPEGAAPAPSEAPEARPVALLQATLAPWLRIAEFGLGAVVLLLIAVTVVLTIRQRRAR
jgi:hypothetical protein